MSLRDQVLEMLREIHEASPEAVEAVLNSRFAASQDLLDCKAPVVVGDHDGKPSLGPLGIVNGVLALAGENPVAALYDDEGHIEEFR